MTSAPPRRFTAEELERLGEPANGGTYELVEGRLAEKPPVSWEHNWIAGNIYRYLYEFTTQHRLGLVFFETPFLVGRDPDTVRRPDVALISTTPGSRWVVDRAPDLAVEVVSPNDLDRELHGRVTSYIAAGSRRVWVVRPEARTVTVHQPAGNAHEYGDGEALGSAEAGFSTPGFVLPIAAVFEGIQL